MPSLASSPFLGVHPLTFLLSNTVACQRRHFSTHPFFPSGIQLSFYINLFNNSSSTAVPLCCYKLRWRSAEGGAISSDALSVLVPICSCKGALACRLSYLSKLVFAHDISLQGRGSSWWTISPLKRMSSRQEAEGDEISSIVSLALSALCLSPPEFQLKWIIQT